MVHHHLHGVHQLGGSFGEGAMGHVLCVGDVSDRLENLLEMRRRERENALNRDLELQRRVTLVPLNRGYLRVSAALRANRDLDGGQVKGRFQHELVVQDEVVVEHVANLRGT